MLTSAVFVLSAVVLAVNAQDCATMPKMAPHECCPGYMPSGMTPALMTECGLSPDSNINNPPPCDVSICILKKGGMLTPDNKIVDKATFTAALEPQYGADFKSLVGQSFDACIGQEAKGTCGSQSFVYCMKGYMVKNCPASVASSNPECAATKAFFDKCVNKP